MSAQPAVSVYVPCFKVEKFIERCIEGILGQSLPADEILIIDDGSPDRTVELARRYPVKIVPHDRNRGLAAARNTGIAAARNEWVGALDADCVADRDWLKKLVEETGPAEVAMVGGKLVETMLDTVPDRWRQAHLSQDWGERRRVNPPFTYGNNSLVRKTFVQALGGYNETYRTNGEDVDLSTRLMKAGKTCVYRPDAWVGHLRQDTLESILDTYWRYWKFGRNLHLADPSLPTMAFDIGYGQLVRSVRKVLLPDLFRGRWELLGMDTRLPFYLARRYVQFHSEARKNAGSVRR